MQSIGGDECSAPTVSMLTDDVQGVGPVALSLPRVVGAAGVARTLWPSLRDDERAALKHSAEVIQAAMAGGW